MAKYIQFTEDQKQRANSIDLEYYLQSKGEQLLASGREKRLKSDHSITVNGNRWYDHSKGQGGYAISFVKMFYDMDFQSAVVELIGERGVDVGKRSPIGAPSVQRQGAYQQQGQGQRHPHSQQQGHPQSLQQGRPQGHPQSQQQGQAQGYPQSQQQGQPQGHPQSQQQGQPQSHPQSQPQYHQEPPRPPYRLYDKEKAEREQQRRQQERRQPFTLPPKNSTFQRVQTYLAQHRGIENTVLSFFAEKNMIYESRETSPVTYNHFSNVVFVGMDENGNPAHAHKRSLNVEGERFMQNLKGSDPCHSFHHIGESNRLYVFEAPIDMLSFISCYEWLGDWTSPLLEKTLSQEQAQTQKQSPSQNQPRTQNQLYNPSQAQAQPHPTEPSHLLNDEHYNNWQAHSYVALCGVSPKAMLTILDHNPQINHVMLCLDNDDAGHQTSRKFYQLLMDRGRGHGYAHGYGQEQVYGQNASQLQSQSQSRSQSQSQPHAHSQPQPQHSLHVTRITPHGKDFNDDVRTGHVEPAYSWGMEIDVPNNEDYENHVNSENHVNHENHEHEHEAMNLPEDTGMTIGSM